MLVIPGRKEKWEGLSEMKMGGKVLVLVQLGESYGGVLRDVGNRVSGVDCLGQLGWATRSLSENHSATFPSSDMFRFQLSTNRAALEFCG
eukprot:g28507.t1